MGNLDVYLNRIRERTRALPLLDLDPLVLHLLRAPHDEAALRLEADLGPSVLAGELWSLLQPTLIGR